MHVGRLTPFDKDKIATLGPLCKARVAYNRYGMNPVMRVGVPLFQRSQLYGMIQQHIQDLRLEGG